jgi:hypothetical protein
MLGAVDSHKCGVRRAADHERILNACRVTCIVRLVLCHAHLCAYSIMRDACACSSTAPQHMLLYVLVNAVPSSEWQV